MKWTMTVLGVLMPTLALAAEPLPGTPLALVGHARVRTELGLSKEQLADLDKLDRKSADANKKLADILKDAQKKRLGEIRVQVRGAAALTEPDGVPGVVLDKKHAKQIARIWKNEELDLAMQLNVAIFKTPFDRLLFLRNHRRDAAKRIHDTLSDEQKAALEKAKGKAFDTKRLDLE